MKRLIQPYGNVLFIQPRLRLLLTISLVWSLSAQAQSVYTFDNLQLHYMLNGQDNWVDQAGQGYAAVYQDETAVNGTKVMQVVPTVISNQSAFLTRVNDSTFDFPPFAGTETHATMQFDLRGDHIALFALGYDWNENGRLEADSGEIGPAFGSDDQHFSILATGGDSLYREAFGSGNSRSDWYRIQLRMDFGANGGQGSGSLYYLNLTDGDETYQAVAGLQNINLLLDHLHPQATPPNWNTLWVHLLAGGGNEPAVDNLIPSTATSTGLEGDKSSPRSYLGTNFPNPFQSFTTIPYFLPHPSTVSISLFDARAKIIKQLVREQKPAGKHELVLAGSALPAGIYYYQIRTEYFTETRKMILLP